jgi:hypothetical protein
MYWNYGESMDNAGNDVMQLLYGAGNAGMPSPVLYS